MSQAGSSENLKRPYREDTPRSTRLDPTTTTTNATSRSSPSCFPCEPYSPALPAAPHAQPTDSPQPCPQSPFDFLLSSFYSPSPPRQTQHHKASLEASSCISAPVHSSSSSLPPLAARSRLPPLPIEGPSSRSPRLAAGPSPAAATTLTDAISPSAACFISVQPSCFWSPDLAPSSAETSSNSNLLSVTNLPGCIQPLDLPETTQGSGPSGFGPSSGCSGHLRTGSITHPQMMSLDARLARTSNLAPSGGSPRYGGGGMGTCRAQLSPLPSRLLSYSCVGGGGGGSNAGGGGGGGTSTIWTGGGGDGGKNGDFSAPRSVRNQQRPSIDAAAGAEELGTCGEADNGPEHAAAAVSYRPRLLPDPTASAGPGTALTDPVAACAPCVSSSSAALGTGVVERSATVSTALPPLSTAAVVIGPAAALEGPGAATAAGAAALSSWKFDSNLQRARMQARYEAMRGAEDIEYVACRRAGGRSRGISGGGIGGGGGGGGTWRPLRLLSALAGRAMGGKRSFGALTNATVTAGGDGGGGSGGDSGWRLAKGVVAKAGSVPSGNSGVGDGAEAEKDEERTTQQGGGGDGDDEGGLFALSPPPRLPACSSRSNSHALLQLPRARTGLDGDDPSGAAAAAAAALLMSDVSWRGGIGRYGTTIC
ncbi:hypothetical protein Agub_g13064 [Astrephomene gubernaculifera]|uniref:Uncharacterized protein n=1 Tax=Astrephomene gubernaculifera TaxID=47775 RepID=A0AAD3E195_9CHLO|nr:hypothetical protein Agub_g13064 [Astrephomene gubernaculifera]